MNPDFRGRRSVVMAVLERVVDYLTDRNRKAWRRGWLHPRESPSWPIFGAYALMVRDDMQLILLDPSGCNIGFPD